MTLTDTETLCRALNKVRESSIEFFRKYKYSDPPKSLFFFGYAFALTHITEELERIQAEVGAENCNYYFKINPEIKVDIGEEVMKHVSSINWSLEVLDSGKIEL